MTVSQDIINLFDRFTHGGMDRRTFMQRLTAMAGGSAAATALLSVLENNYARAEMVAADDSRLKAEDASYPGPDGAINGYLVRPGGVGKAWDGDRHPREPRPQPAHRGRRAPRRARGLHRARARPAVAARRHAGRRGQGARDDRQARPRAKTPSGSSPPSPFLEGPCRRQRQGRRRRLLLGRRHGQPARDAQRPTSPPASPTTARQADGGATCRRSRRRCCSTTPASTSASTPASPPTRRR